MTDNNKGSKRRRLLSRAQAEARRMSILATELGLAGGQVLKDDFGFSDAMVQTWLEKMIDRARANRIEPPPESA